MRTKDVLPQLDRQTPQRVRVEHAFAHIISCPPASRAVKQARACAMTCCVCGEQVPGLRGTASRSAMRILRGLAVTYGTNNKKQKEDQKPQNNVEWYLQINIIILAEVILLIIYNTCTRHTHVRQQHRPHAPAKQTNKHTNKPWPDRLI